MSYFNRQIKEILESDFGDFAPVLGIATGGLAAFLGVKYLNKITCQEPRWTNYVNEMETAIKQAKREKNFKVAASLEKTLDGDIEFCKQYREGTLYVKK